MSGSAREQRLIDSVAAVAGSLVDGDDAVDILQALVDACQLLEGVDQAAIMLLDDAGVLDVVASTSEQSRLIELLQISGEAGPCIECVRTGRAVIVSDISVTPDLPSRRWAAFRRGAAEHGFGSVSALPLRVRDRVIGSLNLFGASSGEIAPEFLRTAQALADIATVSVLNERTLRESTLIAEQLQRALTSRVVIEQAKGVLAHMRGVDMDAAFGLLRGFARSHSEPIADVARRVVALELELGGD